MGQQGDASSDGDAVWDEWGRITRFLEGARLAFARETATWASLQIATPVRLAVDTPGGTYTVDLEGHLEAVGDDETLFASVLIHSYAVAASAAAKCLGAKPRNMGGIEEWGTRLLEDEGHTWEDVCDGLSGAVEVAVVRNAFAHATRRIDARDAERLQAAGSARFKVGDDVTLNYKTLKLYRKRLRELLGMGGINRAPPP